MDTNNNYNNNYINNINNNNNNINIQNYKTPNIDSKLTPKTITYILIGTTFVLIALLIISSAIAWSHERICYYSCVDIKVKPGGFILALIIISIILVFFYWVSLICTYNGKTPKFISPLYYNIFLILSLIFEVVVIICAYHYKEYGNSDFTLAKAYDRGGSNTQGGTYIFFIAIAINFILIIASFYFIKRIIPAQQPVPSYQMNSFNQPQFNPEFDQQFNNNNNNQERQYTQQYAQNNI